MVPLVAASCFSFAISALVLLPVDAVSGVLPPEAKNRTAAATVPTPSAALVSFWRALYWVTLLLGWLATETLCELLVAGEFSQAARLRSALRSSTRLYFVVLVLGVCGLLYLLIWLHLPMAELQAVAPLLVNWHGVLVLALLQGQGMVELPRRLWRNAAPRAALAQKYYALAATDDERSATATRLRTLLHKVSAADAAAPPPVHRSVRERLCWDALLRSARCAAMDCRLEDYHGGKVAGGFRAAWAHTLGTPRVTNEIALAKLRRRVRQCGGVARRAYQRRQAFLQDAALLCERLTANEKGFGGLRVGRSRGLWLGVLRRPFMRFVAAFAALASGWLLANEACGVSRLLPAPLGQHLPSYCPAPLLEARLRRCAPSIALLFDLSTMMYAALCALAFVCNSHILGACPLLLWRRTDGVALLRHAAWSVRLTGPLASHFLLVASAYPERTALAAALEGIWNLRGTHHAAGEETMVVVSSSLDAGGSPGAMGFHGVCSLLMLFAAGCSSVGMCGCKAVLGLSADPACKRYDATKPGHRAQAKRGERLVRHHLATAGALSAAGCPDASSDFGGIAGASSSASLGAGLCIASRLGDGALALSPSMLLDDDTDADTDAEDDVGGRFSTPQVTGRAGRGRTPRSAFARFGGPGGAPSATFADRGAASAPGSRLRGHQCSRRSPRVVRASRVWSRLVLGHEGAAISSDADEGEGASSAEGSVDEDSAYHLESGSAGREPRPKRAKSASTTSAKRVWDAIRSGSGGGSGGSSGSEGTGGGVSWCELTPCTGNSREGGDTPAPPAAAAIPAETWRQLRAERGPG